MAGLKKITKADRWLGMLKTLARTVEQKAQRTIKRMGRICVSSRTHVSDMRIQRNDPCYCKSGKKFKNCCFAKHAVLTEGTMTPAMAEFVKKQDVYFNKKMGRNKDAERKQD